MGNKCLRGETSDEGSDGPARKGRRQQHADPEQSPESQLSTDGVQLSVGDRLRPAAEAVRRPAIHHQGLLAVAAVSPGVVVTGFEGGLLACTRLSDGAQLQKQKAAHGGDVRHFFHSAAHRVLLSCSRDKTVKVWRLDDEGSVGEAAQTLTGHSLVVMGVCANPDCTRAVSGSRDNSVRMYDIESGMQLHCDTTPRNLVHSLRWVGDHTVVQGGENLKLYIWDVRGDRIRLDDGQPNPITGIGEQPVCMEASPDGMSVLVGYKGFDESAAVLRVWDVRMRQQRTVYQGHTNCVTDVAFLPDGRLVSAAQDRMLRVWDEASGDCTSSIALPPSVEAPTDLSLLPDDPDTLTLGSSSGALCVFRWSSADHTFDLTHQYGPC